VLALLGSFCGSPTTAFGDDGWGEVGALGFILLFLDVLGAGFAAFYGAFYCGWEVGLGVVAG